MTNPLPGWIVSWKSREGIHIKGELPPENEYHGYAENHGDVLRTIARLMEQRIPFSVEPMATWQEVDPLTVQPFYRDGELVAVRVREE